MVNIDARNGEHRRARLIRITSLVFARFVSQNFQPNGVAKVHTNGSETVTDEFSGSDPEKSSEGCWIQHVVVRRSSQ